MHVKLLSIKDRAISDAVISAILVHLKDKIEKQTLSLLKFSQQQTSRILRRIYQLCLTMDFVFISIHFDVAESSIPSSET